jgi:hypothetical protein
MRNLRWLLLLGAVVLEVGCGLPDAYFLDPPRVSGSFGISTLNAQITGTNRVGVDLDIQFLGYELYYKFYAPTDPNSTLLQDQGYGGPNNTVSDLQQHGFQRVCLGPGSASGGNPDRSPGYSSAPLINIKSIDPGNLNSGDYRIDIIMNSATPPAFPFSANAGALVSFFAYTPPLPATIPTAGMEIRRFAQAYVYIDGGQFCAPFATNHNWTAGETPPNYDYTQPGQVDVTPLSGVWLTSVSPGGDGSLYLMMYAVSYGIATDQGFQRSSPVLLGYTQIQVIN